MKGIDNILKPLYDLWHKVMDKLKVVDNRVVIDGHNVVIKFVVENIKQLTDEQCEALQCGDVVAKKTGTQFHCYKVTYKEDKHGLVLTYMDASLIEGQSYDYTDGHWVYNSEDITHPGGHTDTEVKALAKEEVESASSGTLADVLGLDSGGNLVKGAVSGGVKLYLHTVVINDDTINKLTLISTRNNAIDTQNKLQTEIQRIESLKIRIYYSNYYYVIFACSSYSGSGSLCTLYGVKTGSTGIESIALGGNLTVSDTVTEL